MLSSQAWKWKGLNGPLGNPTNILGQVVMVHKAEKSLFPYGPRIFKLLELQITSRDFRVFCNNKTSTFSKMRMVILMITDYNQELSYIL
jgi:hypothetical protein